MRIKLNLAGRDGVAPVAVTADGTATVGDVAVSLQAGLTQVPVPAGQVLTLQVLSDEGEVTGVLSPRSMLGDAGLYSGQRIRVVEWVEADTGSGSSAPARLRVIGGPGIGLVFPLRFGPNLVGRDPDQCDVVLGDDSVSRRHARFTVSDKVTVQDLNSSNGVAVNASLVEHAVLGPRDSVALGDTHAVVELAGGPAPGGSGVEFNRSPLVREPFQGREFAAPRPPGRPKPGKLPLVAMVAPMIMGIVMFSMTHNPMSIAFIALSPVIALGTFIDRRYTDKRTSAADRAKFEEDVEVLRAELANALVEERAGRCAEVPSLDAAVQAVFTRNPDLWHRRPEDDGFLSLNLGYGRAKSRHVLNCPERGEADAATWAEVEKLRDQCEFVDDVPLVAQLQEHRNLGVAGVREWVDPVARGLVTQLVCLHSPAEVVLVGLASSESCKRWEWLMWLPHVGSTHSPLPGPHLASSQAGVGVLVTGLEELVAARREAKGKVSLPAVVVLVEDDAPVERGRLVSVAEKGPDVGVHVIWLADAQENLPAACRAYLVQQPDGRVTAGFVPQEHSIVVTRCELLPDGLAGEVARRLSPVLDAGAPVLDQSDLPRSVGFISLAGPGVADDPGAMAERWRENGTLMTGVASRSKTPATLRALIGQGSQGEFNLDLRTQGPHALVGGTTGAGKSEFLQTWVLGMATAHSPQRVTFLFVDYKGGAAFADCVGLPHSVGLVTDLSPHLVRRALTSLRAELRFREHLLNRKKAKDLLALERTGDVECPPSLVIVVDEFAALAKEVPEFVDGVVDVAQRGRSLGLHLVLATQRPAGVITANLRANTNLRVALRMADETDSVDVIDTKLAGLFDPRIPGRGAVRTGPGRVALFQSAYAGGHTSDQPEPVRVEVETLTFGPGVPWEIPDSSPVVEASEEGPTDIARIVQAVNEAAKTCGIPEPRKPWLPELEALYDLGGLTDLEALGRKFPLGVADDPANQAQHKVFYEPDVEGNIVVFGATGSGKSTFLRGLGFCAAYQCGASRTEVYGIDCSTAGLDMLEGLPNVGAIIDGDDTERVSRVLTRLVDVLDERARRYAATRAGNLTEYREAANQPGEARIFLLLDGLSAFREQYETNTQLARLVTLFTRLASEGRAVGIHVAMSAERPGALPSQLSAAVQTRLVLRQTDENAYMMLNIPKDVLTADTQPGRAVLSGQTDEIQIATPAAAVTVSEQGQAIDQLAAWMREQGIPQTPKVERLPELVPINQLPTNVGGQPVIGMNGADLSPIGFAPQGGFLITGMPGSGRTTTLRALVQAVRRWKPEVPLYYFGPQRSTLNNEPVWAGVGTTPDTVKELTETIKPLADKPGDPETGPGVVIVIEGVADFIGTLSETPLAETVKLARRNGHLVIGENETSGWMTSWPLISEIRADRRGIVMQPDPNDGDVLFKTAFPRVKRSEYPLGRGVYVASGKVATVQVAMPT